LHSPFSTQLHAAFADYAAVKLAIAPVKDLQRCVAKFGDYQNNALPCALYICDYFRASTILLVIIGGGEKNALRWD
jgi:hypothetical protein